MLKKINNVYKIKTNSAGGIKMRTNIELDDTLVKKAMDLTKIFTKRALIDKALEELIKSNTRKGMLKFMDSGIWEGDLKKMREMR
ncbi:MAG: type II toxin-antitoxin system VapB family antitoxin [Spirochaetaceae bacterium]|jgi:Arc/MetJ family transcription regulator|nr:type II toxin-antitoxin system VapB family antitoxin [Spirochaetaceae bacterium]